jgi:general secretion pathway protein A
MYLPYYNLKHKPFQISTDPGFLWLGEKHMEALATLRYGVMDNKGFLLLTGDVGTGKTTLINALLKTLGENVLVASIRDPALEPMDFYLLTAHAFGMKREITGKAAFLIQFEQFLNDAFRDKKKVLLIIDEAQRITQELLEEVRLLSNIERNEGKLINIFFVGQVEFNDILLHPVNRPIRQRITVHYNIETLSRRETKQYIRHRLEIARRGDPPELAHPGQKDSGSMFVQEMLLPSPAEDDHEIFTNDAMDEIFAFSKGYPRLINIICDRSLLTGFVEETPIITSRQVKECSQELKIRHHDKSREDPETPGQVNRKNSQPALNDNDLPEPATNDEEEIFEEIDDIAIREVPISNGEDLGQNSVLPTYEHLPTPSTTADTKTGVINTILAFGAALATLAALWYLFVLEPSTDSAAIAEAVKRSAPVEYAKNLWRSIGANRPVANPANSGQKDINPKSGTASDVKTTGTPETATASAGPGKDDGSNSPIILQKLLIPFPAKATLPPLPALINLDMLVEAILPQTSTRLIITGFTDAEKDEAENRKLSESKANAIKIYLISKGMDASRIETRGLGAQFPIAPNTSASQSAENYRVEIEVIH